MEKSYWNPLLSPIVRPLLLLIMAVTSLWILTGLWTGAESSHLWLSQMTDVLWHVGGYVLLLWVLCCALDG